MSDHPTPLNDDDLAKVVGGAGGLPSMKKDETVPDIYTFAKLAQEQALEMRNAARETRSSEMSAQVESLKGAADDIRSAAEHRMQSAIVAGATQIAGGIASMSLQGSALHGMGEKLDKGTALGHAGIDPGGSKAALPSHAGVDMSHATGQSTIGAGMGGIGTIISANMATKDGEASAKQAEAGAAMHNSAQNDANEMMKQMQDVIKDVRDKLSSIEQSRADTLKSINRNI